MQKNFQIISPARIHIGFLNLDLKSNRKFGSLGLTISKFSYKINIENFRSTEIICEDKPLKKKIIEIIKFYKSKYTIPNFRITILNKIPMHNGLGSGTQLTLSIGYLISKFCDLNININEIALTFKRGLRSGIGIESFKKGGFNIDAGKLGGSTKPPLNILNLKWPYNWKILLIFDENLIGIHGKKEVNEFNTLKKIKNFQYNSNFRSLVMNIVPGLMEKNFNDLGIFGCRPSHTRVFQQMRYRQGNNAKLWSHPTTGDRNAVEKAGLQVQKP